MSALFAPSPLEATTTTRSTVRSTTFGGGMAVAPQ
jgi:hypothetical protein